MKGVFLTPFGTGCDLITSVIWKIYPIKKIIVSIDHGVTFKTNHPNLLF